MPDAFMAVVDLAVDFVIRVYKGVAICFEPDLF